MVDNGGVVQRTPIARSSITLHRNALLSRLELLVRAHGGEPAHFASAVWTYVIHDVSSTDKSGMPLVTERR